MDWIAALAALVAVVAASAYVASRRVSDGGIPWARGGLPVVGHALAYKEDPAGFVVPPVGRSGCEPLLGVGVL